MPPPNMRLGPLRLGRGSELWQGVPTPGRDCSCLEGGIRELEAGQRCTAFLAPLSRLPFKIVHSTNTSLGLAKGRRYRLWVQGGFKAMITFDPKNTPGRQVLSPASQRMETKTQRDPPDFPVLHTQYQMEQGLEPRPDGF